MTLFCVRHSAERGGTTVKHHTNPFEEMRAQLMRGAKTLNKSVPFLLFGFCIFDLLRFQTPLLISSQPTHLPTPNFLIHAPIRLSLLFWIGSRVIRALVLSSAHLQFHSDTTHAICVR